MLIHIMPTMYAACLAEDIRLEECAIPELGMHLFGGSTLATKRPWPNKRYSVACKDTGRKAIQGLLINSDEFIDSFVVTNVWRFTVASTSYRTTHVITYIVHDKDFDVVTDDMLYWYGMSKSLGGWSCRKPKFAKDFAPASARPRMDVFDPELTKAFRQGFVHDKCDSHGVVMRREEVFVAPTIERERFFSERLNEGRMPTLDMAFTPFTEDVPF